MPDAALPIRLLRHPAAPGSALFVVLAGALAHSWGSWTALLTFALAVPLVVVLLRLRPTAHVALDPLTGLGERGAVLATVTRQLRAGHPAAVLLLEIDGFRRLAEFHDHAALDGLLRLTAERLRLNVRAGDLVARLDGASFAVVLETALGEDLESALHLAGRLQRALSEAATLADTSHGLTVSVGLALSPRLRAPTGPALLHAATVALLEAQRTGPGAIRSYSDALRQRIEARGDLAGEVAAALENGDLQAYFQPQISTRTGAITGFEALARWHHPSRGLLPPSEFLPAIEQAGLMPRLGERMLGEALSALRGWEGEGLAIPSIGVNFSNAELCDPRLVERIGWELDRYALTADRLVVEVLETVVASRSEDAVIRNLSGLARLGCCLDLDDFGTGHASISSIRRFSIERIKIDRSFVSRLDHDPEQARVVGAILSMADRLGVDTLAEGVETEGERHMLTRLGCGHVQGFGIARPMPFAETAAWIRAFNAGGASPMPPRLRAV